MIREKLANRLWYLDNAGEFQSEEEAVSNEGYGDVMKGVYRFKAAQQITLFKEMLDTIKLQKYEDYYPTTTFSPRYQQSRMAAWSKGQLRLLEAIKEECDKDE